MRLLGVGNNDNIEAQVDPTFQAMRNALRPIDWKSGRSQGGGHYFFETASGALAGAAANSPLVSLRWDGKGPAPLLVLLRASIWYYLTTAYTGAQMNDFDLIRATAFTAPDTGGAAVTPLKRRNDNMAASAVADLRVCTTAALTAGTRTLDGASVGAAVDGPPNVAIPTATLGVPRQELLLYDAKELMTSGIHPIVLNANEGLLIRNLTALGAAGVLKAFFRMEWAEVADF